MSAAREAARESLPRLQVDREGAAVSTETYACPTATVAPDGTPHTIIGCGSTNVQRDETEPNVWDCLDCGLWFDPSREMRDA